MVFAYSFSSVSARISSLAFLDLDLEFSLCCSRKVVQDNEEVWPYVKVKDVVVVAHERILLKEEWVKHSCTSPFSS